MKLPNGYGSIVKLSGKRRNPYCARKTIGWEVTEDGKIVQKRMIVGCYPSREKALQGLASYNESPYDINIDTITFEDVYKKWSDKKYNEISHANMNGYKSAYKSCASLYRLKFKEIRVAHLQNVIDSSGKNYPSLKKLRSLFNQMYEFAMRNDITEKDYSQYVEIGKKGDSKIVHRPFEDNEIQKLWENVDKLDYVDTVLITIYTGMRPSEMLKLEINNVHLNEGYMIGGIKTEAGINRIIPINHKIMPLIKKRYDYAQSVGSKFLIPNFKNEEMKYSNYKREKYDNIMEQLRMSHLPHDGRHTCATLLDRAGANKVAIKRILGHSSPDVTDKVYTHKDVQDLIKAIELI